ncbi:hypothetical protein CCACVL1_07007 [Corchorus capsularis]|uniref:Uncharacterized protein n=1 Tax=Corchorus capsularis TaxID=210143 RepID=A0A1R3JAF6_COCAP|nr:hypothetical protein CCACVL1_07007 [Corchorus capsularis]
MANRNRPRRPYSALKEDPEALRHQ